MLNSEMQSIDIIAYDAYVEEIVLGKVSKTMDVPFQNIIHAAMGLCTEAGELIEAIQKWDMINIREELGDILWYLTLLKSALDRHRVIDYFAHVKAVASSLSSFDTPLISGLRFVKASSELLDTVKKGTFYGKGLNEALLYSQLCKCHAITVSMANTICNCSMEHIMVMNTEKLRKRYETSFTPDEANNRNLGVERETLKNQN